jgi:hypothetical protein
MSVRVVFLIVGDRGSSVSSPKRRTPGPCLIAGSDQIIFSVACDRVQPLTQACRNASAPRSHSCSQFVADSIADRRTWEHRIRLEELDVTEDRRKRWSEQMVKRLVHSKSDAYRYIIHMCIAWSGFPGAYVFACTRSVTCCSIALSSSPFSVTFFSFPKSVARMSAPALPCSCVARTESRIDGRLGAARFPDHDGCVGVVLLHGGVASEQEVPGRRGQHARPVCHIRCLVLPRASRRGLATAAGAYLVAALCSLVWQNRKRSSLSPWPNAYFAAMVRCPEGCGGGRWVLQSAPTPALRFRVHVPPAARGALPDAA